MRAPIALLAMAFAAPLLASSAWALDLRDATGTLVHIPSHPNRIVTLAPSVAELTAEVLGMDLQRIVGVSENTDYPPGLQKVGSIGQYQRFNLERVVALKPDLVLATEEGNSKDQVLHLRELGVPVFVLATGTLEKIELAMGEMAQILGEPRKSQDLVAAFKSRLQAIQSRGKLHAKSPKRVLIQLGEDPLIVAGGGSFLDEALRAIGARNVYGDFKQGYPRPSLEDALRRNPDVILVMAFGPDLKPFQAMAAHWSRYPSLSAEKAKNVQVIYAETLLRPSMRVLGGLGVLEKAVYGAK